MSSYQMSPSIPENISNPDGLSLLLKYVPAIKANPSILILAYPKWSILQTAIFTTHATLFAAIFTPSLFLSLGLFAVLHTRPFFPFDINMMTVHVFDY